MIPPWMIDRMNKEREEVEDRRPTLRVPLPEPPPRAKPPPKDLDIRETFDIDFEIR